MNPFGPSLSSDPVAAATRYTTQGQHQGPLHLQEDTYCTQDTSSSLFSITLTSIYICSPRSCYHLSTLIYVGF